MDTNNLPNPNSSEPQISPPANEVDLESKYKEILEKYATELSQQPPVGQDSPYLPPQSTEAQLISQHPESITELPGEPASQPILQPSAPVTPPLPPQPSTYEPTPPAAPISQDSPSAPPAPPVLPPPQKSSNNGMKFFFFISLLIFLAVAASLAYTLYKGQSVQPGTPSGTPTVNPTVSTSSPTSTAVGSFCDLNDKKYAVNESFAAADGCNLCTCQSDLTISCTEKDCSLTPSPSTRSSVRATPTVTSAVIYKNTKFGFTLTLPASWKGKYSVVNKNNTSLAFNYIGDKLQIEPIFSIAVLNTASWDNLLKQNGSAESNLTGFKITTDSVKNLVYTYSINMENLYTEQYAVEYQTMVGNVKSIISTFKLIQ